MATRRDGDPGPSVKDAELYEKLRDEGNSKEKSARIANSAAAQSRSALGRRGGTKPAYEDWTKDELQNRAKEIGIRGRSSMTKKNSLTHSARIRSNCEWARNTVVADVAGVIPLVRDRLPDSVTGNTAIEPPTHYCRRLQYLG